LYKPSRKKKITQGKQKEYVIEMKLDSKELENNKEIILKNINETSKYLYYIKKIKCY
jgi:hypothetical protein